MGGRSRTLVMVAVAVALCAAAGLGVWRAVDGPEPAGAAGIRGALERNRDEIMSLAGVVGVGIGEQFGEWVIQVYLVDPSTAVGSSVPDTIDGYAVVTQVTGPVVAQPSTGGGSQPGCSGNAPAAGGSDEPGGSAGTVTAVPIEPGAGDGADRPGGGADGPGAQTGLDVRGAVTSVTVFDVTDPQQRAVGSLLVEGPRTDAANYDAASVTITKDTRIFAQLDGHVQQVHPDLRDLQGRHVEVGFTGPVAESYPVQATAAWVTILD